MVTSQLERVGAHLLRQPSFVVGVGVLNLSALRLGALVSRARNGKLLDRAPKPDLDTGRLSSVSYRQAVNPRPVAGRAAPVPCRAWVGPARDPGCVPT